MKNFIFMSGVINKMETNYNKKYVKYKNKINQINNILFGGFVTKDNVLNKIMSIGFEFETLQIHPVLVNTTHYTLGTPIANYDIKEKITLDSDGLFGENTFEITPDFSSTVGNLQEHINLTGHVSRYLRCSFLDGSYHDYTPIVYYDNQNQYSNTEFVATYADIDFELSNDIIAEKFKETCEKIVNYMSSIQANTFKLQLYENRKLSIDNMRLIVDTERLIKDRAGNNCNLCFIDDREYEEQQIRFKPQVTIGIHINSIIDVVSYLLLQTYPFYKTNHHGVFIDCVNESIELAKILFETQDLKIILANPTMNIFVNWLALVIFNYDCYNEYIKNNGEEKIMYFKVFCPVLLRHNYSEICPLSIRDKELIFNRIGLIPHKTPEINNKYVNGFSIGYLKLLLQGHEEFIKGVPSPNLYTTMYPYDSENEIVLLEYRNFGHEIGRILKNSYMFADSLTFNQMIDIATNKIKVLDLLRTTF